jgi:hypothetical protein
VPVQERRALNAIARLTPPHDAFRAAYGPAHVAEATPHPAATWSGRYTRHALANALTIRLAEPNLPDVAGQKYVVLDTMRQPICTPRALLDAVYCMFERRSYDDLVVVVGSDRPVVEWTISAKARGQATASRALRAHPPGVSVAEQSALDAQATGFGHSWVEGDDSMTVLRVRVRASLLRRAHAAAEYDRITLKEQVPRGKYVAAWFRAIILDACVRSEMQRAAARVS